MQHILHTNKDTQKTVSPVAAGLTGIVLGAAAAAAVVLSDEETRRKATKKTLQLKDDLQKWSTKTIHDIQTRGESSKTVKEKLEDSNISTTIKERLDETDMK
ncbi:MAG: hypothetical protein H0W89_00435 [Candidatus Levybacteria bacterium]|nr:hypothetical protein [Candidatus Levybacteria bacterium]